MSNTEGPVAKQEQLVAPTIGDDPAASDLGGWQRLGPAGRARRRGGGGEARAGMRNGGTDGTCNTQQYGANRQEE